MNQEQALNQTDNKKRIMWIGLLLMIVGTVSFSDHEKVGDVLTLIGALVILGSCIWSRSTRNE
ncbi:MAG: hypothetical protein ABJR05_04170 [Balneola sp.]